MQTTVNVRRNSKRYKLALETAHDCKVYSLQNYFIADDCNALALVRYMDKEALFGACRLSTDGAGHYSLHVHSNLWFEFVAQP